MMFMTLFTCATCLSILLQNYKCQSKDSVANCKCQCEKLLQLFLIFVKS